MSEKRRDLPPSDTDGISFGPNLKAKPPKTAAEKAAWGRPGPVRYPDSPSKRLGNWLMNLLTPWKR